MGGRAPPPGRYGARRIKDLGPAFPAGPRRGRDRSRRLEVLGDDVALVERGGEALDLVLHVGVRQALEVADQGLGPAVELLVEALDELLLEDAGARPLAVGAAQADLPVRRPGLLPLGGVDEGRGAP